MPIVHVWPCSHYPMSRVCNSDPCAQKYRFLNAFLRDRERIRVSLSPALRQETCSTERPTFILTKWLPWALSPRLLPFKCADSSQSQNSYPSCLSQHGEHLRRLAGWGLPNSAPQGPVGVRRGYGSQPEPWALLPAPGHPANLSALGSWPTIQGLL